MAGGFNRAKGSTPRQGQREQELIGEMLIHGNRRVQPGISRLERIRGHLLRRPAPLGKPGEQAHHRACFDLQQQRVARARR